MKILKTSILALGIASLALTTSCREEFLETAPTETVTGASLQQKLNGIYVMMINTGTGGTSDHDDFGQKGYDIYSDMLSGDMALEGLTYGWYSNIANLTAPSIPTNNVNYKPWRYYYRIIVAANTVIKDAGGNNFTSDDADVKHAIGQAKALRAYAYFYLSQFYLKEYNPSAPGLPLYTEPTNVAAPLGTQEQLYAQMTSDLEDAVSRLQDFTRPAKSAINADVAKGLLAYVYGAMGNYSKVASLADSVCSTNVLTTNAETTGGFNNFETKSWMWGFDLTIENDLDLVSWWGQIDRYTYSYAWAGDWKGIDKNLYNSISNDDVRKTQFLWNSAQSKNFPGNKFYDAKKVIGGQRNITADYVFMRTDEFKLLAAEAHAKLGDDATAKARLVDLLKLRAKAGVDPNTFVAYVNGLSGQALKDEIYKQQRIELWGEGKAYLNLKRNKKSFTRGANHLTYAGETFNYNDPKLTLSFPQEEILNNPNIQ